MDIPMGIIMGPLITVIITSMGKVMSGANTMMEENIMGLANITAEAGVLEDIVSTNTTKPTGHVPDN
jgi:hypothetical protein